MRRNISIGYIFLKAYSLMLAYLYIVIKMHHFGSGGSWASFVERTTPNCFDTVSFKRVPELL